MPDPVRGVVEVCWMRLDAVGLDLDRFAATLSDEELKRAACFRAGRDRRRYVARHGRLREILSGHLGCAPRQVRFARDRFGKPSVVAATGLRFSASHSSGLALFAVAHGREVGCDVERRDPDYATSQLPEHFFSPAETRSLRSLPRSRQTEGFFNAWTRKEAFLKACGDGLSRRLDSFDVSLAPGQPAVLLRGCAGWSVRSFEPMPGFQAAVVAQGTDWRLSASGGGELSRGDAEAFNTIEGRARSGSGR